ncbi:MAG: hypothetical protein A2Y07_11905 [Planctomycetes bacterium GWF2_50_10]|nr:MAG: hypothetical protein A2Y07_11905 [Planctomycetes bacterium GWF2_50_10]
MSTRRQKAFTLVELLVALSVSGIILAAVATLAYAMGSANDVSGQTRLTQAQFRSTSMRLADLLHNCRLVVGSYANTLAIWRSDLNNNGKIESNEIIFLKTNDEKTILQLKEYGLIPGNEDWTTTIANVQSTNAERFLDLNCDDRPVHNILPTCTNLLFHLDKAPPLTRTVTLCFDLEMEGPQRHYLTYTLCGGAYHLLSTTNALVSDDD